MEPEQKVRQGVLAGLLCYLIWGLCPLFWALLSDVNSWEIIAQRIVWSLVIVAFVCKFVLHVSFLPLLRDSRARRHLIPAGILIMVNWSIYIIAMVTGHVVEAALGYYVNPLVSILLGVVVFKERLTPLQIAATVLSAAGVLYFTWQYGSFPLMALGLASTFGIYSAIKKHGGYPAVSSIGVEGVAALPFALVIIVVLFATGNHAFLADPSSLSSWGTTGLLILGGPITAIPLILFASAANKAPLSIIGFIQYVSPTMSLLIGVFVLGEPFTSAHLICFLCIWVGVALVVVDAFLPKNKKGNETAK